MQHDLQLCAAAQVIYEALYPDEKCVPFPFEEAEQRGTSAYVAVLEAALQVRRILSDHREQLSLVDYQ